jgi:hypothetical protein
MGCGVGVAPSMTESTLDALLTVSSLLPRHPCSPIVETAPNARSLKAISPDHEPQTPTTRPPTRYLAGVKYTGIDIVEALIASNARNMRNLAERCAALRAPATPTPTHTPTHTPTPTPTRRQGARHEVVGVDEKGAVTKHVVEARDSGGIEAGYADEREAGNGDDGCATQPASAGLGFRGCCSCVEASCAGLGVCVQAWCAGCGV